MLDLPLTATVGSVRTKAAILPRTDPSIAIHKHHPPLDPRPRRGAGQ
jgi:hypothetical protein